MEKNGTTLYELDIENSNRIRALKDIHRNERCFIIGTGPSLNETPLDLIEDEISFGCNDLYLGFNEFNIRPQYWAATDRRIASILEDLLHLNTTLFLGGDTIEPFLKRANEQHEANVILIRNLLPHMFVSPFPFSEDLVKGAHNGWTITCDIMLQAAWYMGFNEIYLLGCDWDYRNQSHFYDNIKNTNDSRFYYLTKISYEICKKVFEDDDKKIFNATPNSKLDVFEKVNLIDII